MDLSSRYENKGWDGNVCFFLNWDYLNKNAFFGDSGYEGSDIAKKKT